MARVVDDETNYTVGKVLANDVMGRSCAVFQMGKFYHGWKRKTG